MVKFIKFKRLKIAEQILIVLFCAVIIPMAISGFIINNINQQSLRSQLRDTAVMIANILSEGIDTFYFSGMDITPVKGRMFKFLKDDSRQIYILDHDNKLVTSKNFDEASFQETMKHLPKELKKDKAEIFGNKKNQPLVYVKKTEPDVLIIVNTSEKLTKKTINDNRFKIILSVLAASLAIIIVVGIYTYYLYINIRQLFKGIIAISKGNYERRIRLLTNVFTPYEVVFLAFEFNRMANQIHKSYIQLKKNNVELKQLNEFRSNMIDTVSHEFRTPLTSIQGYTSRLLRQDIQIDDETKQKSLRTIKKQSERLSRMVEDLLVIPDIEGMRIRTTIEPVWLSEKISTSIILVKNEDQRKIISHIREDFPLILADKDRIEQVIVNLLENALKYSRPDTKIEIDGTYDEDFAKIYIKNHCDIIPSEKLNKLFEKFTRIDDRTTRTTRGTGLGLFIVKGLVEAMNGSIKLYSNTDQGFCVEIKMPVLKPSEVKQV